MTNAEWKAKLKAAKARPVPLIVRPWWENPEPRFGQYQDPERYVATTTKGK